MVHSGSVYFGNGERVSANCMRNEGGGKSLMVSSNDLSSLGKVMSFLGKTGGPQIKRESSEVICLLFSSPLSWPGVEEGWLRCYPSGQTGKKLIFVRE